MLKVARAAFFHTCMHTVIQLQCYPSLRLLHSDFGDFKNGVCHVMKITIAKSNPNKGLLTQPTCCFHPDVLARANKMPAIIYIDIRLLQVKFFH